MKKIFAVILALFTFSASAQSFRAFYYGEVVNEGDTINVDVEMEDEVNMYLGFTNVSDNDVFCTIQKEDILLAPNATSLFCVAGSCSVNQSLEFLLGAGDTIHSTNQDALHITYICAESGVSLMRFTFRNSDDASDVYSFYVRFAESVGVRSNTIPVKLSASPNPASSRVTISYAISDSSEDFLVIKNLLGVELYRIKTDGSGKYILDVSSFKPGVYFYGLESKGRILTAKKLLVK